MRGSVLIVDDDEAISQLVGEVLCDEGFEVNALVDVRPAALSAELARLEPDIVLLDGGDAAGYGRSWETAAWLHEHHPTIAVIMFTAHARELAEAALGESMRSHRAAFISLIAKPFDLEGLIEVVVRAAEEHQMMREPRPESQLVEPSRQMQVIGRSNSEL